MIVSFRGKETTAFAAGKRVKAFSGIERAARLKLDRLSMEEIDAEIDAARKARRNRQQPLEQ